VSVLIVNPVYIFQSECVVRLTAAPSARPARIFRLSAQFVLDPQQLIVLGGAVGGAPASPVLIWPQLVATARSAMVESSVYAGTVLRHHDGIAGLEGHLDRIKRFRQGADLVDLDQDRIGRDRS